MAGGTGEPYDVGVARSWPIFSVAAATTGGGPAGLRPAPAVVRAAGRQPQQQQLGYPWGRVGPAAGAAPCVALGRCRPWSTR
ncbi:hypothetical protein EN794_034400 [Mesorhizobium sp. M00.F.Ca.ET.151.01.1.1]|nr:hypothetical protein EN842_25905 [bacterium M00.F.Ca.ET.199.01.1.1]TGT01663.1 hypothetical protein EN820_29290 [bacterium M00.F.Ca.ET.177.01.1.1]TGT59147.1 hypothetical protein EN813_030595 [Mesorhizobium sp. M00.F.Ca.ET.170.01.1.1]TGU11034.1 hypothetical protein EN806_24565 [bacterium M00.F.Ca.ET.163.01.1.1]TGU92673.1 hypothetical protein EN794_034400 [Mesorhizobium sp. M00.F.Ca.ET.151.01.1.1]TGV54771.1 hypothetical protein EN784_34675 [bacterium M00.F.Ca.ET.141.01.1.1]